MKSYSSEQHKIWTILIANLVLAVIGIWYASPAWLWLSVIGYLGISRVGGEIAGHRYGAHQAFEPTKTWHIILSTLQIFNCLGSTISWALTHAAHHKYTDQPKDPHSPHVSPWWKIMLTIFPPLPYCTIPSSVRKDPLQRFYHNHYFTILISTYAILALISWEIPVFLISVVSVVNIMIAGITNIACHMYGYTNFNVNDKSTNNTFVNLITLGGGWHNNHHANPSAWDFGVKSYEWDLCGVFIKYVIRPKTS